MPPRPLTPLVREHADRAEVERRLPPPVVDAFHQAGLFHLLASSQMADALST